MRPVTFDRIAQAFADRRFNRRTALGMTAAAGASIGISLSASRVSAQDQATPEASLPPVVTPVSEDVEFLFVQTASSGTFMPNPSAGTPTADGSDEPGGGADFLLTLDGHNGQTVYFSDRPERITGMAPTGAFLEGFGFSPENPPNAALVTSGEDGETIILVVELATPIHDDEADSITYGASVLAEYEGSGLQHLVDQRGATDFPESFEEASLFIDDCPNGEFICVLTCTEDAGIVENAASCWHWIPPGCRACDPQLCNKTFPEKCNGDCKTMTIWEANNQFCPD